ncbi:MAG: hypothetical protein KJ592_05165 [Nanoarchaeota archaeon]|nr:hypothetical protein [Nanoarchaeota archaeon]
MEKSGQDRGQVTIFIIVGIVIVSALLVFFLWAKPTYFSESGTRIGFEGCVEDVVGQAIDELELKAGFIDPKFTYAYNGEELTYLCYTNNYYETCTVQVPFLKNVFDEQMEILIRDKVDVCYDNSIGSLREQGYDVGSGSVDYDVLIEPGVVRVEIDAPTTVGGQSFTRFNVRVNAPVYDMVMIATSILQFEAKYGDADASSMMDYYPDYVIDKVKRGDGTTVYILENKVMGNKFKFASRSLVFPAGYDLK